MLIELEADAVLSLLSLKYAKYQGQNDVRSSGSTKMTNEAGRLLENGSHQQAYDASNKISPSIRQKNKTGWLSGNYKS